ncbi:hypothetical protein HAP94_10785 [Acidithiobacillus ferrivorans]|nr:hypothetical protein [Acidithiobacillus ferrivorans]
MSILAQPVEMQVYYLRATLREVLWHLRRIESSEQPRRSSWSVTAGYLLAQRDHLHVVRERWRKRNRFWANKTWMPFRCLSRKTLDKVWLLETVTGMEAPVTEYIERLSSYVLTPGSPLRFLVPPVPAIPVVPSGISPAECIPGIGQRLLFLPIPLQESAVEAHFDEMDHEITERLENNAMARNVLGELSETAKWILEHHKVWEALGVRLDVPWPEVAADFKKWVSAIHIPVWQRHTLRKLALHLATHVWEGVFLVEQTGIGPHKEGLSMLSPGMLGSDSAISTGLDLQNLPDVMRKELSPNHG